MLKKNKRTTTVFCLKSHGRNQHVNNSSGLYVMGWVREMTIWPLPFSSISPSAQLDF